MLKRFIQFVKPNKQSSSSAEIIPFDVHQISREQISYNAQRIIKNLQDAGYEAYLVGGGVRDILLETQPKDFDVATSATPEQIKKVFRNARIIGRRFKIVHVRMGREVIEVTTFRAGHTPGKKSNHASQSEKGILLRDNVYGNLESDAYRRDFSINAFYYDPTTQEVIDYTGGLDDLDARVLRIIGDPMERYKEDPVRMLRAVRFACKLGFRMEPSTEAPIREHSEYLAEIPSARLFEEVLKLFMSGSASAVLHSLQDFHLLQYLFPTSVQWLNESGSRQARMLVEAVHNTDKRIRQGKRVTPAFLYAAMLWPSIQTRFEDLKTSKNMPEQDALYIACDEAVSRQMKATAIPKRFLSTMRDIWSLQLRLPHRDKGKAFRLLEHPKFRAAYDFLLLREETGEHLNGLSSWWTKFQHADEETQESLLKDVPSSGKTRKPRRRKRKPKTSNE